MMAGLTGNASSANVGMIIQCRYMMNSACRRGPWHKGLAACQRQQKVSKKMRRAVKYFLIGSVVWVVGWGALSFQRIEPGTVFASENEAHVGCMAMANAAQTAAVSRDKGLTLEAYFLITSPNDYQAEVASNVWANPDFTPDEIYNAFYTKCRDLRSG
jgi:hypothetical protein